MIHVRDELSKPNSCLPEAEWICQPGPTVALPTQLCSRRRNTINRRSCSPLVLENTRLWHINLWIRHNCSNLFHLTSRLFILKIMRMKNSRSCCSTKTLKFAMTCKFKGQMCLTAEYKANMSCTVQHRKIHIWNSIWNKHIQLIGC